MSIVNEKRTGAERRLSNGQVSFGFPERRSGERRQMTIEDISFFEWATHFASFQRGLETHGIERFGDGRRVAAEDDEGKK
jgi:hypothetical protein